MDRDGLYSIYTRHLEMDRIGKGGRKCVSKEGELDGGLSLLSRRELGQSEPSVRTCMP